MKSTRVLASRETANAHGSDLGVTLPGPAVTRRGYRWLDTWLDAKSAPLALAALAALLALPTLRHGFQNDDNVFFSLVAHDHRPWWLFAFSPAYIAMAREVGFLPWWASSKLTFEFVRPLASLMHWFEFTHFPGAPALMRSISVLCYASTVLLAALAYRELLPRPRAAGLAALLFAVDDGHAVPAAWISARNTILAAMFSILALYLYLRARRSPLAARRSLWTLGSAVSTALALASSEAGIWALAYLGAAALVLESGGLRSRLRGLWLHVGVGALWGGFYLSHDYGLRGSGWYRSLSAPGHVLIQGVLDLPLWLGGLFGPGNVDFAASMAPASARLIALPIALVFIACLVPTLRRSRASRFCALGALACIVPMFTTMPQDRLLVGASFGAFGVIGCFLAEAVAGAQSQWSRWGRRLHIAVHGCIAALLFPIIASNPELMQKSNLALSTAAPAGRDVVLIDSPAETLGYYAYHTLVARAERGEGGVPHSLHQLYAGRSDLWFERIDARTLDVRAAPGWGTTPYESFFASNAELPKPGSVTRAGEMQVRVLESDAAGHVTHARFEFPDELEAEHRVWLTWKDRHPVPWVPPAVGVRAFVPGESVLAAITF